MIVLHKITAILLIYSLLGFGPELYSCVFLCITLRLCISVLGLPRQSPTSRVA